MIQANPTLQTFDDFLAAAEGLEARYELTNGELIEIPPETYGNLVVARFLDRVLAEIVGFQRVCTHQVVLEMPGQPKNRFPDLIVLHPDHPEQLMSQRQAAIRLAMAPPMLVVEIVRPGSENHRRDYIEKRNQYEWRGIPEYWIVDPVLGQITVLVLTENGYEEAVFSGDALVRSPAFPELNVTTEAILSPDPMIGISPSKTDFRNHHQRLCPSYLPIRLYAQRYPRLSQVVPSNSYFCLRFWSEKIQTPLAS